LLPTLIRLGRVLMAMASIPQDTGTTIDRETPPPTSNMGLFVVGGIEIISALAGVCVMVGTVMLCQEPRDLPKKVSLWERGASLS
jgi:hypothetical protein